MKLLSLFNIGLYLLLVAALNNFFTIIRSEVCTYYYLE